MPAFDHYSIFPAKIGDLLLRDLQDFDLKSANKKSIVIPGGSVHPSAIVTCCADPMFTFSSRDMDGLFSGPSAVGMQNGYAVNTSASSPTDPALFQMQRRADGGTFYAVGAANHTVGTSVKGFLYPDTIVAQQDDEAGAKATLNYVIMSPDGKTAPITWNNATALTSTPLFDGIWYLGPVRVGTHGSSTSLVPGVQRVEIKSGITFRAPRADGDQWPVNGSIYQIVPEITIRTFNPRGHASFLSGLWGNAFSGGGGNGAFNFFLWKGAHGGTRVATTVAEHIMFTASAGDNTTDDISVNELDDVTMDIVIRATGGLSVLAGQTIS